MGRESLGQFFSTALHNACLPKIEGHYCLCLKVEELETKFRIRTFKNRAFNGHFSKVSIIIGVRKGLKQSARILISNQLRCPEEIALIKMAPWNSFSNNNTGSISGGKLMVHSFLEILTYNSCNLCFSNDY